MTSCQKPDPEPDPYEGETVDTTEAVVKKYLVKEYYPNAPDKPTMVIDWNDDFTRILHITTHQNTAYQLDFSFEYYGNDSMSVVLSRPDYSWSLAFFSDYTCHFDKLGRILYIDYFANSNYKGTEKYGYDLLGKLISIEDTIHHVGTRFVWDGENVCEIKWFSPEETNQRFEGFVQHIHPYSTLPYFLPSGDYYYSPYLTQPLWNNWYNYAPDIDCEFDEDNYVTCLYRINEDGEKVVFKVYEYADL